MASSIRIPQFTLAFAAIVLAFAATDMTQAQGIINVPGDLIQLPDDVLPVVLGGPPSGVNSDLYVVAGFAQLEGRLEMPFVPGYTPQVGDSVNIIQTNNGIFDDFRSFFFPDLIPSDVAVEFRRNSQFYAVDFVEVGTPSIYLPQAPIGNWNDALLWSGGASPTTINPAFVQNPGGDGDQVLVVDDDFVGEQPPLGAHSVSIAGSDPASRMVVQIEPGGALSASRFVNVGPHSIVNIEAGGELLSNEVFIRNDARVQFQQARIVSAFNSTEVAGSLVGNGAIEGSLRVLTGGTVEVADDPMGMGGEIDVTGDYTQNSGGELALDVRGDAAGEADKLMVAGDADLGGQLTVDLSSFTDFDTAGAVTVLEAGAIGATSRFDSVKATGLSPSMQVYAAAAYTPTTVSLNSYSIGDMNRSGTFDSGDVDLFALALRDRAGYESYMLPDGALVGISGDITGDADFDGDLDFDDIDEFIALMPPPAALYAQQTLLGQTIPEPATVVFGVALFGMVAARYRR